MKFKNTLPHLARLVALAALTNLASCATTPSPLEGSAQQRINETLAEAQGPGPGGGGVDVPADVMQALLPPMAVPAVKREMVSADKRFDIAAKDAPARELFVGLAQGTPYSVVLSPDLDGTITINLKNVTLMEALNTLRDMHGYSYEREGDRIKVFGKGIRTRMFEVNYLNFIRKGSSGTSAAAAELAKGSGSKGVSVTTEVEADFWKELKASLEALIGTADGRVVVVNPQSSMVIIRATPPELALVQAYLGQTHETVNRQVMLEAKIVEVNLSDGYRQGINWAAVYHKDANSRLIASQIGGGSILDGADRSEIAGGTTRLDPDNYTEVDSTLASALGGIFAVAFKTDNFAAFFELLKSQGEVHVLSSPRVSTVNNQKALIKIGGDEFFPTEVTNSSNDNSDNSDQTQVEVKLEAFFSGISLDVTPQIDGSGNVLLHIHPTISEVKEQTKSFVVAGGAFVLPTALSTVRESDNVVRAASGQIVVIGGLMQEVSTEEESSVPLLGGLPFVGNFFKHKQHGRVKKELVILIKPTVVNEREQWRQVTKEARERFLDIAEVPKQ